MLSLALPGFDLARRAYRLSCLTTSSAWRALSGSWTSAQPGKPIQKVPLVVSIPGGGAPTGTLFNPTNDFRLSSGGKTGSALFLFAGEDGDLTGWNQTGDQTKAVLVAHENNSVFKGMTMVTSGGRHLLLVANFHKARIDEFNQQFGQVSQPGAFPSRNIPTGYAPFDVATLGGNTGTQAMTVTVRAIATRDLQRRKVRRRVLPPVQRLVPAMFSCTRHQAVFGSGEGIVPPGPLGVLAGFLQRQG